MGNCVSCNDQSSHEKTEYKFGDGDRRNPAESQCTTTVMSSIRQPEGYVVGTGGGTSSMESTSTGSRTPGGSSGHRIISMDSASVSLSQKTEKKAFYSRIPPLGRSGSTDKRNSASANNFTIKDNNNAYSESKIAALFDHYKDPQEESILAEGIEKLCKDLDVKPEDFKMLVLAWKFNAEQMCKFTRDEFFLGMKELKTDTLQGIQARLPDIVTEVMQDPLKFKDLYRFSFKFGLDSDLGQRILPIDMAVSLWRVAFSQKEPEVLERWIEFLEAHQQIRGIPRDTWNMFLNFVETVGSDLSTYDDTEAWPSLFDDFVEYENDKLNQNTICVINNDKDQQQQRFQEALENSILLSRVNNASINPTGYSHHSTFDSYEPPKSSTAGNLILPQNSNLSNHRFSNSSSPSTGSHSGIK